MSIARRTLPSRLELKRPFGSSSWAPLKKVSFTTFLYVSPVQMLPSWDHTGVPGLVALTHFHSSTTSGSASLMRLRILLKVSPRQSPSSAILLSICSDMPDFLTTRSGLTEVRVDELDGHRALADRGGAALRRAGADTAGREHAGDARVEQVLAAGSRTGQDEAIGIARDGVAQPLRA